MADSLQNISDFVRIPPGCRERILPLQEEFARPLREHGVLLAGISDLVAPFTIGRANPAHHTLLYTISGGAMFHTATMQGTIRPNELWIGPAKTAYCYESFVQWQVFWFHLAPNARWQFLENLSITQRTVPALTTLLAAMDGYVSEAIRGEVAAERAALAYAEIIAIHLDREFPLPDHHGVNISERQTLNSLWERVNADLAHAWSLTELARILIVSPAHLHRLCLRHHKAPPMNIVSRLRLRRTAELLRSTDYTLETIASLVGYRTSFALSRAFKRQQGISPRLFREAPNDRESLLPPFPFRHPLL